MSGAPRRAILGLFVAAIALSACSGERGTASGGSPFDVPGTPAETTQVDLPRSYRFDPAVIQVTVGATVHWTNQDDFPHTVRLLDGSDTVKDLPIGGSTEIRFDQPGEYLYECSIHPSQMHGKVIVTGN
jgi:plastocyanin